MLTINVTRATSTGFTATVTTHAAQGLNRASLRTLILNMAAVKLGKTMKELREAGYDTAYFDGGWEVEETITEGQRVRTYKVRPLTAREQAAILRERGGFVDNADGSMGFVMPAPRARVQRPKVRQQGQ